MQTPIGFIVSWRVPAVVALADLRTGLTSAGLDADELAPDLRPVSLVARSASFIAKTTAGKDDRKLARPVGSLKRQITREEVVGETLTYAKEASVVYDEATAHLACDDPTITAGLRATEQHITETRTASDVTRVMQRIVELAGSDLIPVREQGGAYFVPQGGTIITQMDTVLQAIGGRLSRFACTLGHGSDESVADTITEYMLKQIADLQTAIDELNEGGIRSDVKSRRLTRVAELRERVSAYATLVQAQGSKLAEALDTAEATLLRKLGEGVYADPAVEAAAQPELTGIEVPSDAASMAAAALGMAEG